VSDFLPPDHPPVARPRIGVLLVNLGSPEAPETGPVRTYLREFLSDPRVVEIPAWIWKPVLYGVILTTRPAKSAEAYEQIWTPDGSPLTVITRKQAEAMQAAFGENAMIDWAMRYGQPSIASRLEAMKAAGCDRILIAPLYPQYSGATTATVNDNVFESLMAMRWQPAIRTMPPWHDDPAYIGALKASIESHLATLDFAPDAIVASFHSMPERTLVLGDPYHCQCQKTARLLSEALGRPLVVSFQSRLGRAKWLEPATDATLEGLPAKGVKNVAIIAPGFVADNLETLEELAIRGKESFIEGGGERFSYIPCLNDGPEGSSLLKALLARQLEGWLPAA
jgi:protoporphyrin/coproporphyrin ferrochelatase